MESVDAATDAAVGRGLADPDRLAPQGQSYGGHVTAALVGMTNRFKGRSRSRVSTTSSACMDSSIRACGWNRSEKA